MIAQLDCDPVDGLLAVAGQPIPQGCLDGWDVTRSEESVSKEAFIMEKGVQFFCSEMRSGMNLRNTVTFDSSGSRPSAVDKRIS